MAVTSLKPRSRKVEANYTDFAHTGPGTLAGRFLRSGWQPVHRSQDLPVDDDNHVFFIAQHVRIRPGEEAAYEEKHRRYLELRARARPPHELGLEILAGRLTLSDVVDHPYLAVIEDVVAQGGQGRIADRNQERLGRSDTGTIAMRKIWSREMRTIAEGSPTKQWQPLFKMPE